MTNLPLHLDQIAKEAAEIYSNGWNPANPFKLNRSFLDGVRWLYAHLLKAAPAFDAEQMLDTVRTVGAAERDVARRAGRFIHEQMAAQVAALRADIDGWRITYDANLEERDELRAEIERLRAERDGAIADLERVSGEQERFRSLLDWVNDGIEHFTHEDDRAQVLHLRTAILAALNLQPAQQEVRMSPQEKADVLEWALRRAVDTLTGLSLDGVPADAAVLKILADNGLAYSEAGHLVERGEQHG